MLDADRVFERATYSIAVFLVAPLLLLNQLKSGFLYRHRGFQFVASVAHELPLSLNCLPDAGCQGLQGTSKRNQFGVMNQVCGVFKRGPLGFDPIRLSRKLS
jgi:hypothetical protein